MAESCLLYSPSPKPNPSLFTPPSKTLSKFHSLCPNLISSISNHLLNMEHHFTSFKAKFGKKYAIREEHDRRFGVFKSNLRKTRLHAKLNPSAIHDVTKLSNLTPVEFRSHVYIFGQWLRLKCGLRRLRQCLHHLELFSVHAHVHAEVRVAQEAFPADLAEVQVLGEDFYDFSYGDDVVLLKFLRAREFKVNDAFEMLKKTFKWRKESKIDSAVDDDFGSDLASAAYMNGVDHEGHPVCYNIFGAFESGELYQKTFGTEDKHSEFLRWRCQLMEKGIQKLNLKPGGVSSLLQINDLKNSPGPSKIRVSTKQTLAMLHDNYSKMVAKNIFINVPFWYYDLNALLSPFLTQRTKSKFVVARPNKVTETLTKYVIPFHP
ncbi:hypothetical protein JHK82_025226 [Glycine max]|nr:hypothetical protein JHK82_025226 [Glycine max]